MACAPPGLRLLGVSAVTSLFAFIGLTMSAIYLDAYINTAIYGCPLDGKVSMESMCKRWYKYVLKPDHNHAHMSPAASHMMFYTGPAAFSIATVSALVYLTSGAFKQEKRLSSALAIAAGAMFFSCGVGFKAASTKDVRGYGRALYTLNGFVEAYIAISTITLTLLSVLLLGSIFSKQSRDCIDVLSAERGLVLHEAMPSVTTPPQHMLQ